MENFIFCAVRHVHIARDKVRCTKGLPAFTKAICLVNGIGKCDILGDLVLCVQFKKREKDSWRSDAFRKVAGWSL